jgi:hypothetical protein
MTYLKKRAADRILRWLIGPLARASTTLEQYEPGSVGEYRRVKLFRALMRRRWGQRALVWLWATAEWPERT